MDRPTFSRKRSSKTTQNENSDDEDIRERDALAQRIRERERKNTRHIVSKSESRAQAEAAKRLKLAEGSTDRELMKRLREESRRAYLPKRKEDKIYEMRRQLMDDELYYKDEDLTERERLDRETKRQVLNAADEFDKAGNLLKAHRYYMPTEQRPVEETLADEAEVHVGDGRRWENEKLQNAIFHTGAKDAQKTDELDLLLEDERVDFIEALRMPGKDEQLKPQLTETQKKKLSLDETRRSLPVYAFRDEFLRAVEDNQILIICGETGSGKTTQLPQYLYEAGYCKNGKRIGCTQPRRVAAMSVAARVSEEVGCALGKEVGYCIRFEDVTTEQTKIKYMTDGMLLREFLNEPDIGSYSVMMIDEAHERTLHTDILFGLVKDIACFRKDLKLLISSATLDADKFSHFFDDAPIFIIPGRRFPVDIFYTKAPEADPLRAAEVTVLQIHLTQPLPGDILVFLTGQEEIEQMEENLKERIKSLGNQIKELIVLPVYANLPSEEQQKIFVPTPDNARKVVLATNIAETSLTIDGISYVIDPGFVKQSSYDSRSGVDHLQIVTISKAAANQRAGRAGRTGPGKCFRLYTAWAYQHELEDQPTPEIQRTNLSNVVLMLLSLGINDIVHFDYLDPPPSETLATALEQLFVLGALNHKGVLTKMGRRMAEFPCEISMSAMIIASEKFNCSEEIITIAAMLSVNAAIFYRPKQMAIHADTARKGFWSPNGDHLTLLNVYNRWREAGCTRQWCIESFVQHRNLKRAQDVREQLAGLCERVEIELKSTENDVEIRKAITAGYFYNIATLDKSGTYKTVKNRHTVQVHPQSCLFEEHPRWLIYYQIVSTTREYMREVIPIESSWINEVAPHFYRSHELEAMAKKKLPKTMGKSKAELDR
ncbi:hypothetical protein M3Y96_00182600 [Aphelenchoides besseyi]|nr:hypothetical protein M3Y96_00182600 [Aphelenchoides besseyi]